ncbi:MAG: hypothetical protein AB7E32_00395 [Desulfovibrio sp.]
MDVNKYRPVDRAYDPERIEEPASRGVKLLSWVAALFLVGLAAGLLFQNSDQESVRVATRQEDSPVRGEAMPVEVRPPEQEQRTAISVLDPDAAASAVQATPRPVPAPGAPRLLGRDGILKGTRDVVRILRGQE